MKLFRTVLVMHSMLNSQITNYRNIIEQKMIDINILDKVKKQISK